MKKIIYSVLSLITLGLLAYTSYYAYSQIGANTPPVTATSTEMVASSTLEVQNKKTFTTKTGKTIDVVETNPTGASLSTITITPMGFATNTQIILEKNKLTDTFLVDINGDGFDELVIITTAQGSGGYGEATIFTTSKDEGLTRVLIKDMTEDETRPGALFEGYRGHDVFGIENTALMREFPTYNASDTESNPTGAKKKVYYTLHESNGVYMVIFSKEPMTGPIASPITSTTTSLLASTSWTWTNTTLGTTTITPKAGDKFILTFSTSTIKSTTDCNTLNGSYTVQKEMLTFGQLMATKMFCEGSEEQSYSLFLSKTTSYKIEGDSLILSLSDKGVMTFKQKK